MYPGKETFLHLYLAFSGWVITKECSRQSVQAIRCYKSHQAVDEPVTENIASIRKILTATGESKTKLLQIVGAYQKRLVDCHRERNEQLRVSEPVASEWRSVFPEFDQGEDTCNRYIDQTLKLKAKLDNETLSLVHQLGEDINVKDSRRRLLEASSHVDIVNRVNGWAAAGKGAAIELRKG